MAGELKARAARPADAAAIARIYNQGIEDRVATFETEPRREADIAGWFTAGHPLVAVEQAGRVVGYAAAFPYRSRPCYDGVKEFSVYVARECRGRGVGPVAVEALIARVARDGGWKLLSRVFPENRASLAMLAGLGFREVGTYKYHGKLDGAWRDCVIVEYLIEENL